MWFGSSKPAKKKSNRYNYSVNFYKFDVSRQDIIKSLPLKIPLDVRSSIASFIKGETTFKLPNKRNTLSSLRTTRRNVSSQPINNKYKKINNIGGKNSAREQSFLGRITDSTSLGNAFSLGKFKINKKRKTCKK